MVRKQCRDRSGRGRVGRQADAPQVDESGGVGAGAGAGHVDQTGAAGYTLGRETYQGGKWIEIKHGRPLQRGRDLFGSGADYGKAANDVGGPGIPAPPVWRAGANKSTRLMTEVPLTFGKTTVPAGEYSLFIDLKLPAWTLIISSWPAQSKYDPERQDGVVGRVRLHA